MDQSVRDLRAARDDDGDAAEARAERELADWAEGNWDRVRPVR